MQSELLRNESAEFVGVFCIHYARQMGLFSQVGPEQQTRSHDDSSKRVTTSLQPRTRKF